MWWHWLVVVTYGWMCQLVLARHVFVLSFLGWQDRTTGVGGKVTVGVS